MREGFLRSAAWCVLVAFSVGCGVFSFRNFEKAFPVTSLELTADRSAILKSARSLRSALNKSESIIIRPVLEPFEVAEFTSSDSVQNFMELEGGGNGAFSELIVNGTYKPFKWRARHYLPGVTSETVFLFGPDGKALGFYSKLPESEPPQHPGNIKAEQARALAVSVAREPPWNYQLSLDKDQGPFALVEESLETQPSGRVDHTLVFELSKGDEIATPIGEGRIQIVVSVSGPKVTSILQKFKVPQAFSRRYSGMRSLNEALSQAAWIAIVCLYGIGVLVAVFSLLRSRALIAMPALYSALIVSALLCGALANDFVKSWMNYDTALSPASFRAQAALTIVTSTVLYALILWLSVMAAEGLTRKSYPNQLQLWSIPSTLSVLCSREVVSDVFLGYLLVPVMFAYEVSFYFLNQELFGWWTPSSPLVDPNITASYLPFLSPIAMALFAGYWEEALFRAVPLAGARSVFKKSRYSRFWDCVAMGVQAIIFGAAHANYPAQPSYARLVELILPSLLFGALFVYRGLVPGVIMHFIYDLVWMGLPIFLSIHPTAILHRIILTCLGSLPLLLPISLSLLKPNTINPLSSYLNSSWTPPPRSPPPKSISNPPRLPPNPPLLSKVTSFLLLPLALALSVTHSPVTPDIILSPFPQAPTAAAEAAGRVIALRSIRKFSPNLARSPARPSPSLERALEELREAPAWFRTMESLEEKLVEVQRMRDELGNSMRYDSGSCEVEVQGVHDNSEMQDKLRDLEQSLRAAVGELEGLATGQGLPGNKGVKAVVQAHVEIASNWTRLPMLLAAGGDEAGEAFVYRYYREEIPWLTEMGFLGRGGYGVRFVRMFNGLNETVEDKAEEWYVHFPLPSYPAVVIHTLPESHPGLNLTKSIARDFVVSHFKHSSIFATQGSPGNFEDNTEASGVSASSKGIVCASPIEKLAVPVQHPKRTDWKFEFQCRAPEDKPPYPLELRVTGVVTGREDGALEVLKEGRYIKPPEEFEREHRSNEQILELVSIAVAMGGILTFVCAAGYGLYVWSTGTNKLFSSRYVNFAFTAIGILAASKEMNNFWGKVHSISTAQPVATQVFKKLASFVVSLTTSGSVLSMVFALSLALSFRLKQCPRRPSRIAMISAGGIGVMAKAGEYTLGSMYGRIYPTRMNTAALSKLLPILDPMLQVPISLLMRSCFLLILCNMILHLETDSIAHKTSIISVSMRALPLILFAGVEIAGTTQSVSLEHFAALATFMSLCTYLGYILCFRRHTQLVPLAVAGWGSIALLGEISALGRNCNSIGASLNSEPYFSLILGYSAAFCLGWVVALRFSKALNPVAGPLVGGKDSKDS
ncbi:hypothetical protein AAMO2058_000326500 [Amorphochlora amoebiformis]